MQICLRPIGVVHVNLDDEQVEARFMEGVEGMIEIYEEYVPGLEGVEGFSHLIVIAYLHKISDEQRRVLKVKPKPLRLLAADVSMVPEVGVFATNSPHRPNPLALTIVELIERSGRFLKVRRLDLFDKTPVLDIKPYTPSRAISEIKLPKWYEEALGGLRARHPCYSGL
ncbi:MAG: tRNA (N6-threonylcarbamoyladenosine(37)-N6)-methyltransferase TrmO [Candidatus Nezhaarchaeota archaeon]|nr:tRNA (N6-threonylcarbamoyladenosine(37)-N6)-methyltransferase TrmO [Candidatus Nezhaarchaeota archaeon]MCX8141377.1 tRNA (N6-threonylcarbamoyladenosine(37)-N6)-methyltransferase TrmO [Candidatus Nezhaarchaeota archaeon]